MIIGNVKNRTRYASLGKEVMQALDYFASVLENPASGTLEKADIELPGGKVRIKVRPMNTKPVSDCAWEAHKKELDIHFTAYGEEKIGVSDISELTFVSADEARDMIYLDGAEKDYVTVRPGTFLIVYPEDAHMPCVTFGDPAPIGKMIAKIAVDAI